MVITKVLVCFCPPYKILSPLVISFSLPASLSFYFFLSHLVSGNRIEARQWIVARHLSCYNPLSCFTPFCGVKYHKIKFHEFFCVCYFFSFSTVTPSLSPVSLSFSLPSLSLFLSFFPAPVSLSIFLSPIPVVSLSYCHSCFPVFHSLHPCLSFSLSVAVSLSSYLPLSHHASLLLWFSLSLLSPSLSFSRPYLSISLEPRSLFLSLSFYLSLSLQSMSLCLCRSLSLSLPLLPFFLSLSHTLSFYLFSRSLSHSYLFLVLSLFFSHSYLFLVLCLSLFFLTLISFSLSLSPIPVSLFLFFQSLFLSLSHSCLSFHLFSLQSLSSSSLSPTHVSLSIFVSPLSFLLPLCGSLSPSLFDPYLFSYLSLSHRCLIFYILLSLFLSRQSLSLPRKKENIKSYCNIEKENL